MPEIGTMQQINSEPLRTATVLTPQSQAEQYAREAQQAAAEAAQSATDAQTAAASAQQAATGAVKYSEAQTLTAAQQAQARANIGAADTVALAAKQDAPAIAGTEGQVLTIDDHGDPVWATPTDAVSRQEFDALDEDVTGLKSTFDTATGYSNPPFAKGKYIKWVSASQMWLYGTYGSDACTPEGTLIPLKKGDKIILTNYSGVKFDVYTVNTSNVYKRSTERTSEFVATEDCECAIDIYYSPNVSLTDALFRELVSRVYIINYNKGILKYIDDVSNGLESDIEFTRSLISSDISKNLVGLRYGISYPVVPPLEDGETITVSAFDTTKVTSYTTVRLKDDNNEQLAYFQFDDDYLSGRTVTLNLGSGNKAHYIQLDHDCGSPLMLERGNTKTSYIPHYETNYEKYLSSVSDFGKFGLALPDQADVLRNGLAKSRFLKRLSFCHVSDNHSTIYKDICEITDLSDAEFIINTGDLVLDTYADSYTSMASMINAMTKPHYITLGNHDVSDAPSSADIFTKYFDPIKTHNDQGNLDKTYYSVDFQDEKIKCIFLDPYDDFPDYEVSMGSIISGKMSGTQINWLIGQLDDAITDSMHVCIFIHLAPEIVGEKAEKFFDYNTTDSNTVTYGFIADIIDAYMGGTSVSFTYNGASYSHTFTGNGVFVGYFCGHMHCDCIGRLKTHTNQIAVSVTRPWISTSVVNGLDGTYRYEDSLYGAETFNYVTVDPQTRHLSIMRVLQQKTKYGFKRDFVTLKY